MSASQVPHPAPVTSVTGAQLERTLRAARTPLLMRGAAARWPAVSSWTPEVFGERFADLAVTPSMGLPDTEVPYQHRDHDFRRSMTMAEFIRRMRAGERCYVDQMAVEYCAGLGGDYDFAAFEPEDVRVIALWIGAKTCSGLHYDWVDNLFAQVYGTKQVILAAPEEARHLYPFPDNHTKSQVAPLRPDLQRFPRFGEARLFAGVVEPGDVLYIPKGWWHYFAAPTASISLTCWYGAERTPAEELSGLVRFGGPRVLAGVARDFVWHGLMGRPYQRRLFSLPPSGLMLYQLVRGLVASGLASRSTRRRGG